MKILTMILVLGIVLSASFTGCARAEFEMGPIVITPKQVVTGEEFAVNVDVANVGNADGAYTATLMIDDVIIDTREVTVAAGATETITFVCEVDTSGTHNLEMNGLGSAFTVLSPAEIADQAHEAAQGIQTCQGVMTFIMHMEAEQEGETLDFEIRYNSQFAIDDFAEQMEMIMDMSVWSQGEFEGIMTMEMYLLGDTLYSKTELPGAPVVWQQEEVSPDYWESVQFIEEQMSALEGAEINFVGMEKINGVNCYVLDILPTEEAFLEAIWGQQQLSQQLGEEIDLFTTMLSGLFFKSMDISMQQWIDEDTFLLKKADMAMELDLSALGLLMEIDLDLYIHTYDEPISIELPAGAEQGITSHQKEAAETELANVQAAVHSMMVDNELAWLPNPVTVATNDMSAFPDATSVCGIDKLTDYYGNPYKMNFDKDGYVLYQHDITGDGAQIGLVNYLASQYTTYWYYVDAAGTVTQVPTSAPETAPDVVQEKVKDIESIMGRAEGLGIHVEAVAHEGEIMTITCQADDYTTFRDYLIALEESGRFSMVAPPSESFSYITGGAIELEPKYQYIDMPAVYYEVNLALAPMTASDAIAILVGIAEGSGIDIDPNVGKLRIAPATIRQVKAAGNTYQVLSFRNIQLQGDYEDVMAFISDLDSRKTLRTMILTRVVIIQIEAYGKIETAATVDVDIYTIES